MVIRSRSSFILFASKRTLATKRLGVSFSLARFPPRDPLRRRLRVRLKSPPVGVGISGCAVGLAISGSTLITMSELQEPMSKSSCRVYDMYAKLFLPKILEIKILAGAGKLRYPLAALAAPASLSCDSENTKGGAECPVCPLPANLFQDGA